MNVRSKVGARDWAKRLAWLLGFWLAGVTSVGMVALVLKTLLRSVGLTT